LATRSRTSFQKRQKEIARAEKQRDKAAKRQQRKLTGGLDRSNDEENPGDELTDTVGDLTDTAEERTDSTATL